MHHSKLIQTLQILNARELKRLLQFLKSPFYNSNPNIINLYLHLRNYFPAFDSPKLTKEKVFKKLFPNRNYDHQKLLNLMSDFRALIEKYLQVLQLEKEGIEQKKMLLKVYAERPECYPLFKKNLEVLNAELDALPYQDANYYHEKHWLEQMYFNHPGTDKFRLTAAQYEKSMQHLDNRYILDKLLLSCEMKAREKPLSEEHNIWLLEEIKNDTREKKIEDPVAEGYKIILDLLDKGNEQQYFKLKKLFLKNTEQFSRTQQQNILQSLINYTVQKGNTGEEKFLKENFELFKIGLQEALFINNGVMSDANYNAILIVAIRNRKFSWAKKFIVDYATFLAEKFRQDVKTFGMALWHYYQNKLDSTIEQLHDFTFLNDYYQIQGRVLLLRTYFEKFTDDISYYELLATQAQSFNKYVRRNDVISKARKEALINFIQMTSKIAKLKVDHKLDKNEKEKLKLKIRSGNYLDGKVWLLDLLK